MNLNTFNNGLIKEKTGDQEQSITPQIPSQFSGSFIKKIKRKRFVIKVEANSVEEPYKGNLCLQLEASWVSLIYDPKHEPRI